MATSAPPAAAGSLAAPAGLSAGNVLALRRVNPLVLWHLLSLDAPSVAMLWTWFLARANHVRLPAAAVLAMGLAVWMLYAADRLLDARADAGEAEDLEARHHFHRGYRREFAGGIVLAALLLAFLLPGLAAQAMRLYAVLGAMLFAYFVLIHAGALSARRPARRLPKELAVGVFFSAAVFIPTVAREPGLRAALLPAAVLFGAVCSLNCLFIYAWEHPGSSERAHGATKIALRFLSWLAAAVCGAGLLLSFGARRLPYQISAGCALAAGLLLLLHCGRRRFAATTLRAGADLCLLTPILLLPLLL